MSLFSYIAFPREPDTGCIVSLADPSRMFTVKELRGTKAGEGFGALPDDAKVYLGDILADFQGLQIYDKGSAEFHGVFDNPFVYSFAAELALLDEQKYLQECASFCTQPSEMEFAKSLVRRNRDSVALCRRQLCELIMNNLKCGEKVEIYSQWVSGVDFDLGPPANTVSLGVSCVASSELLGTNDRIKTEICR